MFRCLIRERIVTPVDQKEQSDTLQENKFIRVSKLYSEGKQGKFLSYIHEDARTLYESFRRGAKVSNNGRCLGWRERPNKPYQWIHYNETLLRAKNIGSGLIACGLIPGPRTAVGLYSQNCPEWILTEQACYTYSLVVVPLHDTLGPDACEYIINETEISTVICDDDKKCSLLLDKAPRSLRKLIVIKEISLVTYQKANDLGIQVHKFEDIERIGSQNTQPEVPPKPLDLCTICYTPSTTGNPQGVMLTHQNIMAGICSVLLQLGDYKPTSKDTMISFLPLAHMLERCCENGIYAVGGSVGFYSGNIRKLSQDMKALKPTFMPAVPRLLNRLYEKVHFDIQNSFFKRIVFNMGIRAKETHIKKSIISKNSIWDRLIFKKIQSHLGGKLRLMIVGSAPLAGNILTFARCTLGCLIVEGYGQTECCAPITLTLQGDHTTDHVGPPVACCCIKLVDIPEMEYYVVNNQGEICVKGTNVFVGYYKNPQKTEEIIDQQGWHHTGDIGMWLPNGTLKIIDRKKHIFKLSQGEHVVPEKIEKIYIRSQYVHQVFVYGESLKSCVIAVVVPDANTIKCWAAENNISGTLSVLCANSKVKTIILNDMFYFGKNAGLKTFEQVKDIYIHPDPFSVQNGLLGPTLKLKRSRLRTYFKPQLEDLYQHLD